jgi:hypothetical protein
MRKVSCGSLIFKVYHNFRETDMTTTEFKIRLQGLDDDLTPESVSPQLLAKIIEHFTLAIMYLAKPDVKLEENGPSIGLTGVLQGSTVLVFKPSAPYIDALHTFVGFVSTGHVELLPRQSYRELTIVHKNLSYLKATLEINGENMLPGFISPLVSLPKQEENYIRGGATLFGECTQIGGVEPSINLRVDFNGKMKTYHIKVPKHVAEDLSRTSRLYTMVAVEGTAKWNTESWEIEDFEFSRVTEFENKNPVESMANLREISKGLWDDVDPIAFVRSLREGIK